MYEHLLALKAATTGLYETYLFRAPQEAPEQYLVWQSGAGGLGDELPVAYGSEDLGADVRLLARATTGESVAIMLRRLQRLLSPNMLPGQVAVDGRHVTIQWLRTEFIGTDPEVTIPGSNRHPAYGVDTYHLSSQPRS